MAPMDARDERKRRFSAWFQKALAGQELSQADFTARLQRSYPAVTSGLVSRWYNGETLPTAESILRIADVLGVDADWLLAVAGYRAEVGRSAPSRRVEQMEEVKRLVRQLNQQVRVLAEPLEPSGVWLRLYGPIPADALRWVRGEQEDRRVQVAPEWIGTRSPDEFLVAEVSGDCLTASYHIADGDYVLIERLGGREPATGSLTLVRVGDDYSLKVWRRAGDWIELHDGAGQCAARVSILDEVTAVGTYVTHWRPVVRR